VRRWLGVGVSMVHGVGKGQIGVRNGSRSRTLVRAYGLPGIGAMIDLRFGVSFDWFLLAFLALFSSTLRPYLLLI
jgi:hypothetical protein